MTKLRVTYTKSSIGYAQQQKDTIKSLGLHRMHDSVVLPDTPSVRGMLTKVSHLVRVDPVKEAEPEAG